MLAQLQILWVKIRDSLWFIPGLMTVAAGVLAVAIVAVERQGITPSDAADHWFLGGGAEGARGVLSAIAGGLITVTGVVFSITIVALQLASSQFTPRVLRNFTADRANQVVLGVFIGTFTYTLLVLRTVHSASAASEAFIPRVAVSIAVGLVLVSIGFLIFFISHAARSIQVSAIIDRITCSTLQDVDRLFPEHLGTPGDADVLTSPLTQQEPNLVQTEASGYLQAVDARALFEVGQQRRALIRMEPKIGAFLLPGETLVSVWPATEVSSEMAARVQRAFVLGPERTPEQDVEFGIIELSDIAVKALSPGINDPTTAFRCIDRLGEILLALGTRNPPRAQRTKEGQIHFLARYTTLEQALSLAFDQIRHFGADNEAVMARLVRMLARLEGMLPEARRPALAQVKASMDRATRHLAVDGRESRSESGSPSA